jgi:hypothetical protein
VADFENSRDDVLEVSDTKKWTEIGPGLERYGSRPAFAVIHEYQLDNPKRFIPLMSLAAPIKDALPDFRKVRIDIQGVRRSSHYCFSKVSPKAGWSDLLRISTTGLSQQVALGNEHPTALHRSEKGVEQT